MKRNIIFITALVLAFFAFIGISHSSTYDPGYIISDEDLLSPGTMTYLDIQQFLEGHNGILDDYYTIDIDGHFKTAAMIIHDAAERYNINPQILLVLLQKEQGLITDPEPYASQLDWATGYAVCDRCDVDHPLVVQYKGFAKQVDKAAWRLKYYVENIDQFTYKPGFDYIIDGQSVFINNIATASLYNYTPHLSGNKIFFQLWQSWFFTLSHPSGTLLQAYDEPGVWLIKNGKRHAFMNKSALTTRFDINQIIQVPKQTIEQYPIGPEISYPEYALLRVPSGKIYLLVGNELRWIVDEETFRNLGFMSDEIENTTETELEFFQEGLPITLDTLEPYGSLIQDPQTYGIYFVKNGIKRPLIAPELLSLNYSHLRVRKGSIEELDRYEKGSPVTLNDGLLVKTADDATVYVISNGKRMPIDSEYTFNTLGYSWNNIHVITDKLMQLHPLGDTLSVAPKISDDQAAELLNINTAG